jgi:hypothetical protein
MCSSIVSQDERSPMPEPQFDLWLEFECWEPQADDDPRTDFFNMKISLPNGNSYGLNVWTYDYFAVARHSHDVTSDTLGGGYLMPPDLFVERLDRALLERVVAALIRTNQLREAWLIHEDNSTSSLSNPYEDATFLPHSSGE